MTDTSGAIPEDDNDTVGTAQDGGLDNSGVDVVQQVLDYGRQKYGLTQGGGDEGAGVQKAGYIPTIPAGPGGDKPGDPTPKGRPQPQPIQQPGMPVFGKRTSMSFEDGGPVVDDGEDNRYPELNALKAVGSAVQGAIPENADPNVDRASNLGNRQINDMADSAASDVGSALKGAGSAVMGALAPQGAAEANASTANDGVGDAMTALADGAQQSGSAGPAIPDGSGDPNMGPGASESASGSKNLLTYMTADAAPPHVVAQAEAAADPHGQMPEGQRKLAAVQAATEQGGHEAGWGILQSYRQKYELLRQGAAAAADSGDLEHAASLATKAFNHLPDGTDVVFHQEGNGVTATVTQGDKTLAKVPLSPEQFRQYVGAPQQQFDNALNSTPAASLQQAAKAQGFAPGAQQNGGMGEFRTGQASVQARLDGQPSLRGQQPQPGGQQQAPRDAVGDMSEIHNLREAEQAAARMFPNVGAMAERRAFVLKYMQEGGQKYPSEQRAAETRGDAMRDVAGVRAVGGINREGLKQDHADKRNATTNDTRKVIATSNQENQRAMTDSRNKAGVQGKVISSLTPVNDKRLKQAQDAAGSVTPTQAPTPQAATPQAATPQAQPQGGAQQRVINGVTYTKVPGGWKKSQ